MIYLTNISRLFIFKNQTLVNTRDIIPADVLNQWNMVAAEEKVSDTEFRAAMKKKGFGNKRNGFQTYVPPFNDFFLDKADPRFFFLVGAKKRKPLKRKFTSLMWREA